MASFEGDYTETFTVPVPPDRAKAHFSDVETIGRNYGPVERWEKLASDRIFFLLLPQSAQGVTFQGSYTARYFFPSPDVLQWETLGQSNMVSVGQATFRATPSGTQITYNHKITLEMPINRILAKVIGPIVSYRVRDGVKSYLERMRASLR